MFPSLTSPKISVLQMLLLKVQNVSWKLLFNLPTWEQDCHNYIMHCTFTMICVVLELVLLLLYHTCVLAL